MLPLRDLFSTAKGKAEALYFHYLAKLSIKALTGTPQQNKENNLEVKPA